MNPRRVLVVAPDPAWPTRFTAEANTVRRLLGDAILDVHHVGSTSVPGLWAKPVVDLLPVVSDLAAVDAARASIEADGFLWRGEYGMPGRRYLVRRDAADVNLTHVHIFTAGHPEILRHLAFRDHLRAHADVADAYAQLKRELAARFGDDREGYTNAKAGFIEAALAAALAGR